MVYRCRLGSVSLVQFGSVNFLEQTRALGPWQPRFAASQLQVRFLQQIDFFNFFFVYIEEKNHPNSGTFGNLTLPGHAMFLLTTELLIKYAIAIKL